MIPNTGECTVCATNDRRNRAAQLLAFLEQIIVVNLTMGEGVRVGRSVNGIATIYLQDRASGLPVVLRETSGRVSDRYS